MSRQSRHPRIPGWILLSFLMLVALASGSSFVPALSFVAGAKNNVQPANANAQQDHPASQLASSVQAPQAPVQRDMGQELSVQTKNKLSRSLAYYRVLELNTRQIKQQVKSSNRVKVTLGEREYDMNLELRNLRDSQLRWVVIKNGKESDLPLTPVSTYKGTVVGDSYSTIRLDITDESFAGYIKSGTDWLFIDELSRFDSSAKRNQVVAYYDRDVLPGDKPMSCGSKGLRAEADRLVNKALGISAQAATPGRVLPSGMTHELEIVTDGDFEFWDLYDDLYHDNGVSAFAAIERFINGAEGIFENQLNLTFRFLYATIRADKNGDYPYSATNANDLLFDLATYWSDENHAVSKMRRDTTHLFSGKYLSDSQGLAMGGGTCTESRRYGLSSIGQDIGFLAEGLITKVVTHELAHGIGAEHDDEVYGIYCGSIGPLMCSTIQITGPFSFSDESKSDMNYFLDRRPCLNPPPVAACKNFNTMVINGDGCKTRVTPDDIDNGSYDPDGQPLESRKLSLTGENGDTFDELYLAPGNHIVTLKIGNYSKNENACSASVTVVDRTIPSIQAPPDITVPTNAGSCTATNVDLGEPIVGNGCTFQAIVSNDAQASYPLGTTYVRWKVTDNQGTGTVIISDQKVTVVDTTAPTITLPTLLPSVADANCKAVIPNILPAANASDSCTPAASIKLTQSPAAGTQVGLGEHQITVTAKDAANNSTSTSTTFNVKDTTPPVLDVPDDVTMGMDTTYPGYPLAQCGAYLPSFRRGNATATDCNGVTIMSTGVSANDFYPLGTSVITYTATDGSGNKTIATQRITIVDDLSPFIAAPNGSTVSADGSCEAFVPDFIASAQVFDRQCATSQVQVTQTPAAGTRVGIGTHTITLKAVDGAGNETTSTRTKFTVQDSTGPAITAPSAVTVQTDSGTCSTTNVTLGSPQTSDSCSTVASVENDAPSVFPLGQTTVTWTATDSNGNKSTSTQLVTVRDGEKPNLTAPSPITVTADSSCTARIPDILSGSSASDSCTPTESIRLTQSPGAGSQLGLGSHVITVTAIDAAGNSKTATTTVTIKDVTPPAINYQPDIVVAAGAGQCSAVVNFSLTASDNCSGVAITTIPSAGSVFPVGTTTVVATAKDTAGNFTQSSFKVIVQDTQTPTINNPSVDKSALWPANHQMADVTVNYNLTDNCVNANCTLSVTSNEPDYGVGGGDRPDDIEVVDSHHVRLRAERFNKGDGRFYTITITCVDLAGNASIKTVPVYVAHKINSPNSGSIFPTGTTVTFTGSFRDVVGKKHTAQWSFDNIIKAGTVVEPTATAPGSVMGSYSFKDPGVYLVKLKITDSAGAIGEVDTVGETDAFVVVYDPKSSYIAAGGWFDSVAGAYALNPTLSGRASYGFYSKSFSNALKVGGETQFGFRIGDFLFNSPDFDSVTTVGTKVILKGTASIGNDAGYNFQLTVIPAQTNASGVDLFRIKVWKTSTGFVIYDTQMGAPDNADPTTRVGEGSKILYRK